MRVSPTGRSMRKWLVPTSRLAAGTAAENVAPGLQRNRVGGIESLLALRVEQRHPDVPRAHVVAPEQLGGERQVRPRLDGIHRERKIDRRGVVTPVEIVDVRGAHRDLIEEPQIRLEALGGGKRRRCGIRAHKPHGGRSLGHDGSRRGLEPVHVVGGVLLVRVALARVVAKPAAVENQQVVAVERARHSARVFAHGERHVLGRRNTRGFVVAATKEPKPVHGLPGREPGGDECVGGDLVDPGLAHLELDRARHYAARCGSGSLLHAGNPPRSRLTSVHKETAEDLVPSRSFRPRRRLNHRLRTWPLEPNLDLDHRRDRDLVGGRVVGHRVDADRNDALMTDVGRFLRPHDRASIPALVHRLVPHHLVAEDGPQFLVADRAGSRDRLEPVHPECPGPYHPRGHGKRALGRERHQEASGGDSGLARLAGRVESVDSDAFRAGECIRRRETRNRHLHAKDDDRVVRADQGRRCPNLRAHGHPEGKQQSGNGEDTRRKRFNGS